MCTYCWPKTTSFILIAGDRGEKTALAQHLEVCGGHCITHFSFCCLAYFLLRCSRPRSRRSSSSTALRTRGEMVTSCLHMLLCWENCGCPFFFKSVFQLFRVVTVKGRLLQTDREGDEWGDGSSRGRAGHLLTGRLCLYERIWMAETL